MELTDKLTVEASPADVWALVWDLPRLAKCLPGCERIEPSGDAAYKARMTQKVGLFQVSLDLDLSVQESVPEQRVVVTGNGGDRMGNRITLNRLAMEMSPAASGQTDLSYVLDFNLYGRLATLGNAVIKRKAEEVKAEFSRRIAAELAGGGRGDS